MTILTVTNGVATVAILHIPSSLYEYIFGEINGLDLNCARSLGKYITTSCGNNLI